MQHCASKTKDNNALDDVFDGILDAFNPGGRVQPWRTRSTLTGMVLHIATLFSHLLSP